MLQKHKPVHWRNNAYNQYINIWDTRYMEQNQNQWKNCNILCITVYRIKIEKKNWWNHFTCLALSQKHDCYFLNIFCIHQGSLCPIKAKVNRKSKIHIFPLACSDMHQSSFFCVSCTVLEVSATAMLAFNLI